MALSINQRALISHAAIAHSDQAMSTFVSALSGLLVLLRCPGVFQQVQDDFLFTAQARLHFSIGRSQGFFNASSLSFERMT